MDAKKPDIDKEDEEDNDKDNDIKKKDKKRNFKNQLLKKYKNIVAKGKIILVHNNFMITMKVMGGKLAKMQWKIGKLQYERGNKEIKVVLKNQQ